jgi:hypothetical protein
MGGPAFYLAPRKFTQDRRRLMNKTFKGSLQRECNSVAKQFFECVQEKLTFWIESLKFHMLSFILFGLPSSYVQTYSIKGESSKK